MKSIILGGILGNIVLATYWPPVNLEGWIARGIGAITGVLIIWPFYAWNERRKKGWVRKGIRCFWQDCKQAAVLLHQTRFTFCEEHGQLNIVRPKSIDVQFKGGIDLRFDFAETFARGFQLKRSEVYEQLGLRVPEPGTQFKVGDWVRVKPGSSGSPDWHGVLMRVLEISDKSLYALEGIARNMTPTPGITRFWKEEELEPALPRKGEWWIWDECDKHSRHRAERVGPWKMLCNWTDGLDIYLKCGCLVPLNFGRGEQSSDPTAETASVTGGQTWKKSTSSGGPPTEIESFKPSDSRLSASSKFKVGDWARVREDLPGAGELVQKTERTPHGCDWLRPEQCNDPVYYHEELHLEAAVPLKDEWWAWEDCKKHGDATKPSKYMRYIRVGLGCCLIPVNFGKGNV